MKVSNERLEEICSAMVTDSLYDYEQVFDSIKAGEIYNMAKELLESRKAHPECNHDFVPDGYGYGFRNFRCLLCRKVKTERTECPD